MCGFGLQDGFHVGYDRTHFEFSSIEKDTCKTRRLKCRGSTETLLPVRANNDDEFSSPQTLPLSNAALTRHRWVSTKQGCTKPQRSLVSYAAPV